MMLAKIDWEWWFGDAAIKPIIWWLDCPYFFMPRLAVALCGVEIVILVLLFVAWRYEAFKQRH